MMDHEEISTEEYLYNLAKEFIQLEKENRELKAQVEELEQELNDLRTETMISQNCR